MMSLPYKHLSLKIIPEKNIFLHFPEALFRGAFGNTLRNICCINKRNECEDCFLHTHCVFANMYYPTDNGEKLDFQNIVTIPPPYSFYVDRKASKPDELSISVILYDRVFSFYPYIIYAFIKMGKEGIGKNRIKYKTESIKDCISGETIYSGDEKEIKKTAEGYMKIPDYRDIILSGKNEEKKMTIDFLSPLRIKEKGRLLFDIDFKQLIKYGLIRLNLLYQLYGTSSIDDDVSLRLIKKSEEIKEIKNDLRIYRQKRFSGSQKKQISMDGIIGKKEYIGNFDYYKDILDILKLVGLGKNTTFGCGRFEYIIEEK